MNKFPKSNSSIHSELLKNNWVLLKEPRNMVITILLSIPFLIIAPLVSVAVINIFSGFSFDDFGLTPEGIIITINVSTIVWLILLVVIHEFIHLLFIPHFIKSKNTYMGFAWFGAFVITEEEISKSRYMIITLAPFVMISIIFPLLLGAFGLLTTTLKILILLNSMASSVDLLNFLLIMTQVPRKDSLKNNGASTYWRCL